MSGGRILLYVFMCVAPLHPLAAQRTATRPAARGTHAIRAEYAGVLLRAKRYSEAAAEYRKLLAFDSANAAHRLGLARALAWGGWHREAERELRLLVRRLPRDGAIADMLRAARASFQPPSSEALKWVREQPGYAPYRRALARALVKEGRARRAFAHFDTLLRASEETVLLREAADAHALARDHRGSAGLLKRALAMTPRDTALRRDYARALWAARDGRAAIAEYDRLIADEPNAERLLDRGKLHAWMRNDSLAERDLRASLELRPTVAEYLARGDLHRWRGAYRKAREAYLQATTIAPDDRSVRQRLSDLAREERPALASSLSAPDELGWLSRAEYFADNSGYEISSLGLRHGFSVGQAAVLSLGAEQHRVAHAESDVAEHSNGFSMDAGVTRTFRYGRLSARLGALRHSGMRDVPQASLSGTAWWRSWRVALDLSTGAAYPLLTSLSALRPVSGEAQELPLTPLAARRRAVTVSGSAGAVDMALVADIATLSDGNERVAVQTYLRYPLNLRASAVYGVSDVRFRQRSDMYWDPRHHAAHGVGLEYAARGETGLAYRMRALGGLARSVEDQLAGTPEPSGISRFAAYLSTDGEIGYRASRWDAALGASYGRGRSAGYERFGATARVRVVP